MCLFLLWCGQKRCLFCHIESEYVAVLIFFFGKAIIKANSRPCSAHPMRTECAVGAHGNIAKHGFPQNVFVRSAPSFDVSVVPFGVDSRLADKNLVLMGHYYASFLAMA
jgi:hypothetical protein